MAANISPARVKHLEDVSQSYQKALGLPAHPAHKDMTQAIHKLGNDNNVLISFELHEIAAQHGAEEKPILCACVCVCACID